MKYLISIRPGYKLTEDDMDYLSSVDISYDGQSHVLVTEDICGHALERIKGDIRRIPNQELYDNLCDDFRLNAEPKPKIRVKIKAKARRQ